MGALLCGLVSYDTLGVYRKNQGVSEKQTIWQSVFYGALMIADDPDAAMEELGIPAEMKADIGKHAYYPNSEYVYPIESDELQEKFYDHVTTMTLVRYYLRHPKDMLTMMNRAAQESVTLSTSFMTYTDALYSDIPGSDQAQAEKDILAAMGKNVKTVPLHDVMMSHRGEYIYFRTDHHWTGLGAYYAYREFCGAKGVTPHALSEYEVSQYDGFLGSFYNDGGKPDAMKNNPDVVTAYHPISTEARMQYGKSDSDLTAGKIIYDESEASAGLKYGAFIMGDNPYTVISNPDLSDGSSCVVVKESFGNAFVPFLVDHYQTVYVIDYRYYSGSVVDFAKTNKATDVIFVNNLSAIRGSYQMGKLAGVK